MEGEERWQDNMFCKARARYPVADATPYTHTVEYRRWRTILVGQRSENLFYYSLGFIVCSAGSVY